MNQIEKIQQLQSLIGQVLTPLITSDYWLLEVPYYTNIGDTLIWQGEIDFLSKLPYRRRGMSSYFTDIPKTIKATDVILLQGGGNFGDLYFDPQNYRMRIVQKYPNNKIIIFPQTVWFEHERNMKDCAEQLSKCPNLTICTRDKESYDILKCYFVNDILLVPDMAFCIDISKWKTSPVTKEALLLKREDKELKMTNELVQLEATAGITVTDWPTFTESSWQKTWFRRTLKYAPVIFDWYAYNIFRPYLIKSGVELISSHKKIFSTRLHAAILSILLCKARTLIWFDNSYGKNKNFFETWLKDCDGIQFIAK